MTAARRTQVASHALFTYTGLARGEQTRTPDGSAHAAAAHGGQRAFSSRPRKSNPHRERTPRPVCPQPEWPFGLGTRNLTLVPTGSFRWEDLPPIPLSHARTKRARTIRTAALRDGTAKHQHYDLAGKACQLRQPSVPAGRPERRTANAEGMFFSDPAWASAKEIRLPCALRRHLVAAARRLAPD